MVAPATPIDDATTVKTWFNTNKGKQFSEVSLQCSLPFKKTNFEMDLEEEEDDDQEEEEDDGGDILK